MDKTASTDLLERRKLVRVRLRDDLDIAPHKYEGRTYYVIKDPVSLRYYRFKEQEHFLLQFMNGTHTLDEAQKEFEKRFRPERLTLEDLEAFAQQLLTAGLGQNEAPRRASNCSSGAANACAWNGCRSSPTSSTSSCPFSIPIAC